MLFTTHAAVPVKVAAYGHSVRSRIPQSTDFDWTY